MTTTTASAALAMSTSACPTPTVSMKINGKPAASSTATAAVVDRDRPPSRPRVASERMNTPSSVACRCMRTRSPSKAPPENGLEGSTATTPTRSPAARARATSASTSVDLPTPGDPVTPTTNAPPVLGYSAASASRAPSAPSSRSRMSRAAARRSPPSTSAARSFTLYHQLRADSGFARRSEPPGGMGTLSGSPSMKQLAGDDHLLHLVSALADLGELRVAQVLVAGHRTRACSRSRRGFARPSCRRAWSRAPRSTSPWRTPASSSASGPA